MVFNVPGLNKISTFATPEASAAAGNGRSSEKIFTISIIIGDSKYYNKNYGIFLTL